jgi:hypothetical protein
LKANKGSSSCSKKEGIFSRSVSNPTHKYDFDSLILLIRADLFMELV